MCCELLRLSQKLHKDEARVAFLRLAFGHNLVHERTSYELLENGYEGSGERHFDSCFEMGDSQDVRGELIEIAEGEGFIEHVRLWCGEESFNRWSTYANRQTSLF